LIAKPTLPPSGSGPAEFSSGDWRLLVEGEATVPLAEHYDSGLNGKSQYPIVADPGNGELNRLQLQYRGINNAIVTLGRQRITIDDQRFVGNSGWRQNEQTFDAVRFEYGDPKGFKADLPTAGRSGPSGDDGKAPASRQWGNNVFATISHPTPVGTLSGFPSVDQDEAEVQGFRLSSQSYGLRSPAAESSTPRSSTTR
jgi:hypothetical protein